MLAKINSENKVLVFPYLLKNLIADAEANDAKITHYQPITFLFERTVDFENGCKLIEVEVVEDPTRFDSSIQKPINEYDIPFYDENSEKWVVYFKVVNKTQEEIDEWNSISSAEREQLFVNASITPVEPEPVEPETTV